MSELQADASRNVIWIGVVAVLVVIGVGYIGWTYFHDEPTQQQSVVSVNSVATPINSKESEHYSNVLKDFNNKNANAANQDGHTYVSTISTRPQPVVDVAPKVVPSKEGQKAPQIIYVNAPSQPSQQTQLTAQDQQQQQDRRRQAILDQTKALTSNWSAAKHEAAVATEEVSYAVSVNPVVSTVGKVGQGDNQSGKAASVFKILDDFIRIPALLDTDLDTDENSEVTARVPSGPYEGLTVYATGYKRINESIDMTFTTMTWKKHSYKIVAKAIDQNTQRSALSGEVDNRYFTRIILPAIAAGIGRTGQLYEQSSAQNIITPQGGVIQTYPTTPNGTAVIGTMVGGVGEQAGKVLAQDAAQMPTKQVLISKNVTIGIQFLAPVLSSDDLASGASAPVTDLSVLSLPASTAPIVAGSQNQPRAAGYQARPSTQGINPLSQGSVQTY
ncbi:conjugal transfer protein TraO [Pseudomonas sp. AB12(2023)]|uniref:conjugal transfer protein TraO n=1 Tax=Pseudomonas sp. AB12(2023) TaxID=3048597 RepID=UPI002B23C5A2|nr:conjugal transfer protein TraO [Pseudomonas sp. AB12(2023)]MEB0221334.1 conjugal transfer protein TraO [Pseudomonas sp. AB12(2023)]